MVFSSLYFTFFFLPLVVAVYYLSKEAYRNCVLLAASLCFYAHGEHRLVLVLLCSIATNYGFALWIGRARAARRRGGGILALCAAFNVGALFLFKYLDFSLAVANRLFDAALPARNIPLPIGISFFTFQALSYVIDVYRGNAEPQRNLCHVALYISFFPQLVAGPIVRYGRIASQIAARGCTLGMFADGFRLFLIGFCKKMLLANTVAAVALEAFRLDPTKANPAILWLGSVCYSLQIFYDFSGYSDMAIGLGKLFGFEFESNFDYPYISRSATEFWRRWHISLGKWFRDYVYIPLGGSRTSVPRQILNLLVVWLLTGMWHGANCTFIAWGLGHFTLLVIEKYVVKMRKPKSGVAAAMWRAVVLLCVNCGWVLFNSPGMWAGLRYTLALFGYYRVPFAVDSSLVRYAREYGFFIAASVLFATPLVPAARKLLAGSPLFRAAKIAEPFALTALFLWATSFIILGAHNPFIYFNF